MKSPLSISVPKKDTKGILTSQGLTVVTLQVVDKHLLQRRLGPF
jgi:hypothetical protein